jgi:hypothetical protein
MSHQLDFVLGCVIVVVGAMGLTWIAFWLASRNPNSRLDDHPEA